MSNENVGYYWALQVYDEMDKYAEPATRQIGSGRVWSGSYRKLCNTISIPEHWRALIITRLRECGSLDYLQRGAAAKPSQYGLLHRPTLEEWLAMPQKQQRERTSKERVMEQRIKDLTLRVNDLEREVRQLRDVVLSKSKVVV
jgi:hypothetical protein